MLSTTEHHYIIASLHHDDTMHIIKTMARKKKKMVRTTISLPSDVHQALRIEAITKKMSMGELIVQKLKELEEYREKYGGVVKAEDYLI